VVLVVCFQVVLVVCFQVYISNRSKRTCESLSGGAPLPRPLDIPHTPGCPVSRTLQPVTMHHTVT